MAKRRTTLTSTKPACRPAAHVLLVAKALPFARDDPQRAAGSERFLKLRQPAQLPPKVFIGKIERRDFTIRLDSQLIQQAFGMKNFLPLLVGQWPELERRSTCCRGDGQLPLTCR